MACLQGIIIKTAIEEVGGRRLLVISVRNI